AGTNFLYPNRAWLHLSADNKQLLLDSTGAASLVWRGTAANPTFWDVNTTGNWQNGGNPSDVFLNGDNVTFDDTATTYTVAIQGASVSPGSVTFNNGNTYTITGGAIGGIASATKNGTGIDVITNHKTYAGG